MATIEVNGHTKKRFKNFKKMYEKKYGKVRWKEFMMATIGYLEAVSITHPFERVMTKTEQKRQMFFKRKERATINAKTYKKKWQRDLTKMFKKADMDKDVKIV